MTRFQLPGSPKIDPGKSFQRRSRAKTCAKVKLWGLLNPRRVDRAGPCVLCRRFFGALSLDVSNKPEQIQAVGLEELGDSNQPEDPDESENLDELEDLEDPDDPEVSNMLGESDFAAGLLMYAIMFLWRPNRCESNFLRL